MIMSGSSCRNRADALRSVHAGKGLTDYLNGPTMREKESR